MKTARKIFVLLLFTIYYLLFTIAPASAQNLAPSTNADVPQNMHTWTQTVLLEVLSATACQLTGIDPIDPRQRCLGVDSTTGKIGYVQPTNPNQMGGAIGITTHFISQLFNIPVHTTDYFAYLGDNFGVAKKAYAQGAGFSSLSPLVPLWSVFRNLVYLAFVVVFVFVGLAIMLRVKIDPRTVMSIENSLPKIIIGIILVTFSLAIAGFLIDLMYISMYLIFNIITSASPQLADKLKDLNPAQLQGKSVFDAVGGIAQFDKGIAGGPTGGLNDLASRVAEAGKTIIQSSLGIEPIKKMEDLFKSPITIHWEEFGNLAQAVGSAIVGAKGEAIDEAFKKVIDFQHIIALQDGKPLQSIIDILSGIWAVVTAPKLGSVVKVSLPVIGGFDFTFPATIFFFPFAYAQAQFVLREILPFLIIYIIVFVALLWALFQLGFALLKAYIFILLDIVLAPFWIVGGVFPGSPVSFGGWLRDIVANLSAFPVTLGMFLLGAVFINIFNGSSDTVFLAPLLGNPTGGKISPIAPLIGIGIILMTPSVVTMMKELLKAPQLKYTSAIGQATGAGLGAVNVPEQAQKLGMLGYYSGHMKDIPVLGRFLGRKGGEQPRA